MKPKDRMLTFIRGQELDLVPFAQYDGMVPADELYTIIDKNDIAQMRWTQAHRYETPNCTWHKQQIQVGGNNGLRSTLTTPVGTLTEIKHFEPTFGTAAIKEHFIKDPSDYKAFMFFLRDIDIVADNSGILQAQAEFGEYGIVHNWIGRTPYQQMWSQWVSLEDLALHMMDEPEMLEECLALLGDLSIATAKAIHDAPIPYVVIGDNITAPMIGERYFRKYCLPYYNAVADIFADRDIPLVVHMDGDLKPLWQAIGESKVIGLDSFSPPPDNDTSAADAVSMWPKKKLMLNFPSSVHLQSKDVIYATAMDILEQAGHTGRLQIQISENVPPNIWRTSYPQIIKAIKDFGKP